MSVRCTVEIQAITSIRRGRGEYDVARAIVTGEVMGNPISTTCQIVHRRGDLEVGRLNENATVSITLRPARDSYSAQLSIFLLSRLRRAAA